MHPIKKIPHECLGMHQLFLIKVLTSLLWIFVFFNILAYNRLQTIGSRKVQRYLLHQFLHNKSVLVNVPVLFCVVLILCAMCMLTYLMSMWMFALLNFTPLDIYSHILWLSFYYRNFLVFYFLVFMIVMYYSLIWVPSTSLSLSSKLSNS